MLRGTGISTHVPRTGHDPRSARCRSSSGISIHAPLTGRDAHAQRRQLLRAGISIHVPKGCCLTVAMEFQSTCPVRGTTCRTQTGTARCRDFNPRAPYGARPHARRRRKHWRRYFNPRAPYGARLKAQCGFDNAIKFQSTCPVRGTTIQRFEVNEDPNNFNPRAPYGARRHGPHDHQSARHISIHVPRTGHDSKNAQIVFCIFAITDNKSGKVIM